VIGGRGGGSEEGTEIVSQSVCVCVCVWKRERLYRDSLV